MKDEEGEAAAILKRAAIERDKQYVTAINIWRDEPRNAQDILAVQPAKTDPLYMLFKIRSRYNEDTDVAFSFYREGSTPEKPLYAEMAFSIERTIIDTTDDAGTVEDIEKLLFHEILKGDVIHTEYLPHTDAPPLTVARDTMIAMRIALQRAGSSIAKKSRRGRGNVYIAHPDDYDLVYGALGSRAKTKVVARDTVPPGKVLVMYKGTNAFDACAIYVPVIDESSNFLRSSYYFDEIDKYTVVVQL